MEKTFSEDNERVMSVIEVWDKEEKETVSYIICYGIKGL